MKRTSLALLLLAILAAPASAQEPPRPSDEGLFLPYKELIELLGKNTRKAPKPTQPQLSPVEYVLHALAGCMTTTMVYHAAASGITIESVETELEGDLDLHGFLRLDESVRNGYENIRVSFKVKSDATPEQLADLARFSPVFDIVSNPVAVSVDIQTA